MKGRHVIALASIMSVLMVTIVVIGLFLYAEMTGQKITLVDKDESTAVASADSPETSHSNTDLEGWMEEEGIDRSSGLSIEEFWRIYNYLAPEYDVPILEEDEFDYTDLLERRMHHIRPGIYLGYTTLGTKEAFLKGDGYDTYRQSDLEEMFELMVRIVEGDDSRNARNAYQSFKDLYKTDSLRGNNVRYSGGYYGLDYTVYAPIELEEDSEDGDETAAVSPLSNDDPSDINEENTFISNDEVRAVNNVFHTVEHKLDKSWKNEYPLFTNNQNKKLTKEGIAYIISKYVE
ncbi:hypothetical protein HNQ41_003264, partial [Texcoconibacillus texcoconensis]|nr:hypothetical protein [Texcoconibacillus texcoconensis]